MNNIGIFSEQEIIINNKFFVLCAKEYELLVKLLQHKESLVMQLSGKIKDTDKPDYSIELMLAYNLPLLNGAVENLANGYLGVSQIILRTVLENTCLSMYFFEFPKDEKKYRKNRKSFNCKLNELGYDTWIEGWLNRIDKEGEKFSKLKGEDNAWYRRIFTNIVSEASSFVHVDIDFIYGLVYIDTGEEKSDYALGPNWSDDLLVKNALWKIIETCLYSCAVLDRVFKKYITVIDMALYKDAINQLNNWKKFYDKTNRKKNN
ncbi:hypothetical protein KKE47_04150 [Patescibacteria group bacterium]|nr:hypothetical protein [Patescibacteria group bacterium]MCG2701825.1 hypothetical protein [Candidatus Parcubacteria bacterium]MBU4265232.1 hypothetical protein [Patescibacteria group bacterium]MBU4390291.1 hypothetical protein [Patescibacteria group bacterium]MBU4431230.1 hypothetical protein [Patescibacteria group bacterium]